MYQSYFYGFDQSPIINNNRIRNSLGTGGGKVCTTSVTSCAVFSSLASQAAVMLINNKGDISKMLKDIAQSDTVTTAQLPKFNQTPTITSPNGMVIGVVILPKNKNT